jgi:hypothetical protein
MPVIGDVGADFVATSQDPAHIHAQLHTVPVADNGGTTTTVTFTDSEGNPIEFADANYVAMATAEGEAITPDESTKTVRSVVFLNAANHATNDVLNVIVIGRLATQPPKGGALG